MRPLVLLRVSYMELYDGPGTMTGGGAYVQKRGVGGEMLNFCASGGRCYGYASIKNDTGIDLAFLDPSREWQVGDELDGVDVVFFARRPEGGQVIVGWYKGATVFHKQCPVRRGVAIPGMDAKAAKYVCVVDAANAVLLLPGEKRTFQVPHAPSAGVGFSGQSNVWYPDNQVEPNVVKYVRQLRRYIATTRGRSPRDTRGDRKQSNRSGGGRTRTPNHALNAIVEDAAVDAVMRHYEKQGYAVKPVESENLGWDIYVTTAKETLRVEVKGVSASSIRFELTPNEYAKLREHSKSFRVCVVCDALAKPRIFEFTPRAVGKVWKLWSAVDRVLVQLMERTGATGVEVPRDTARP